MLGAWALAFGCAIGSDAFVMPWTTFLPKAGPLGAILGIVIGGLVMGVIAWNYHYMIIRKPGPSGVYAYAAEAFGHDHGFLCGFFLGFAYIAIVWLDVTALELVVHYLLGDVFNFGFRYVIEGKEIFFGDILLAVAAIAATTAICCRRRLSGVVQTVLGVTLAAGIVVCFMSSAVHHEGGLGTTGPLFAPSGGNGLVQTLNILAIAPWLFVGFEAISNSSAEFRFPARRSFGVMLAALISAVAAYVLLAAIPVLTPGDPSGWPGAVAGLGPGDPDAHAFDVARRFLGKGGVAVIGATLIAAIFTNLVGNTVAASRLTAAMANDGALPAILGGKNADGAPRNAVLGIAVLAILIVPLGSTVIGVVVDISIMGAAIAYAYTSAATFKLARADGDRRTQAMGLVGLVISITIIAVFVLPTVALDTTMLATESYLVLIGWGLAGLATFLTIFHRDKLRRFGRSPVVWICLFIMITLLSAIWIRQKTKDTTERAYQTIISAHTAHCLSGGHDAAAHADDSWRPLLRKNLSIVNRSIIRNSFVQGGLNLVALVLMFWIYAILRRRERDIEHEKAAAKSYFFSTVSHDIRTPLNAIIGFSEMLKAGFKSEQERKDAIDAILMSGKTLLGLVNDVLDLSKLESGKMEIVPEPTDCSRLMRELIDMFRVTCGNPDLELRYRGADMPVLMLDPQRLRQIVFNLVGNAVKFTKKGHVELRVSFERAKDSDAGTFRLEVEDTGCGISEEDKKRIGSAYVQVGAKTARNGGTGLGLAICKQLAVAMGGSLDLESELEKGSTFSITIPNVKPIETDGTGETDGTDAIGETGEAGVKRVVSSGLLRRILIVDDAKMNLMVLKALLRNIGDFDVAMASDGQEALAMLKTPGTPPFDLVITDMWMPNLDGKGLVKAIRADATLKSLRVAVATADVEFQDKAISMGFDGIIIKPITSERISTFISSLISQ
jgi:signal transduction histidine kinase/CheY-like chemotaxis protein